VKYLLLGKERFLKQEFVLELRKKIFPAADPGFNLKEFTAKKDSLGVFFDFCRTAPFLSEKRLAIFWDAEKLSAADKENFLTQWNAPFPGSAEVVVSCDESNSRRDDFLRALSEKIKPLIFHAPYDRDFPGWIAVRAKKHAVSLDRIAAGRILECVGKDLARIDSALDQLSIFVSPKTVVTGADVDALLGKSAEQDVFLLMDFLIERNAASALTQLRRLWQEGAHGIEILAVLATQVDKLKKAFLLLSQGASGESIGAELRIHSFFLDKFLKQLERVSSERLKALADGILKTDHAIKTGRAEQASAVELLVLRLCEEPLFA
jgi:DNA polymerase-3 subunit delta